MNNRIRGCKKLHREEHRCCTKAHYRTRKEANLILNGYLNRVLMSSMVVYRCYLHDAFELGHDKYVDNKWIVARDDLLFPLSIVGGN